MVISSERWSSELWSSEGWYKLWCTGIVDNQLVNCFYKNKNTDRCSIIYSSDICGTSTLGIHCYSKFIARQAGYMRKVSEVSEHSILVTGVHLKTNFGLKNERWKSVLLFLEQFTNMYIWHYLNITLTFSIIFSHLITNVVTRSPSPMRRRLRRWVESSRSHRRPASGSTRGGDTFEDGVVYDNSSVITRSPTHHQRIGVHRRRVSRFDRWSEAAFALMQRSDCRNLSFANVNRCREVQLKSSAVINVYIAVPRGNGGGPLRVRKHWVYIKRIILFNWSCKLEI